MTPAVACPKHLACPWGMANGKQAEGPARPGPEGGRIEPAEPEPPPALFISRVG